MTRNYTTLSQSKSRKVRNWTNMEVSPAVRRGTYFGPYYALSNPRNRHSRVRPHNYRRECQAKIGEVSLRRSLPSPINPTPSQPPRAIWSGLSGPLVLGLQPLRSGTIINNHLPSCVDDLLRHPQHSVQNALKQAWSKRCHPRSS